jgi:phosphinothricin acetyltransferase
MRGNAAMDELEIRNAKPADAGGVAAIYGHHVLYGTASYDLVPPPVEDIRAKIEWVTAAGWPFLVAEQDGLVVGYAYATQFRDRDAYRFTAEDSIYVHPEWMGRGVGSALLNELIDRSVAFGFRTIIAVIGGAEPGSIALHAKRGFREVGRLSAVGWKHERWLDSVYMQLEMRPAADY